MKAITAKRTKALNIGTLLNVADNSGAKIAKLVAIKHGKGVKGRQMAAGIADHVKVSIRKGIPEMKKQIFDAVIVRQKKEWRRLTGERISFADNAVVILKDEKGDPKGTQIKGPIAREVLERWPSVAKLANIIV
ncbi:MAG: 50S ribosomal protein L14 [Candidatus Pacearchaeota archaeon]